MPRHWLRAPRHHTCKASTQKSLVSWEPKISVKAPVNSTSTPSGTNFSFAGGSWSQPFATFPARSVRVFPPSAVFAHAHLGLGIDGDFQRLGVALDLAPDRLDVGKDGLGLLGLPERLALLNPLEAVVH